MKNTFKFMGIALMATALLFTSCKKDDQEGNDTTPAPQTETSSYKVYFGGEQVNGLNYVSAMTDGQLFLFQAAAGVEGNEMIDPCFQLAFAYLDEAHTDWYIAEELQYTDGTSVADRFPTLAYPEDGTEFTLVSLKKKEVTHLDVNNNAVTGDFVLGFVKDEDLYVALSAIFEAEGFTQEEIDAMDATSYNEFVRQALTSLTDESFSDFELVLTKYKFRTAE